MRHLLVFLAFRAGMALVGVLPGSVARGAGMLGGFVTYLVAPGRRRMVRRHARRLGATGRDVERTVRAIFVGYGRYWAEALWIRPGRVAQMMDSMGSEGLEHVRALQAHGRGMVLVLPHVGNWEFAGPVGADLELPLLAVAENLANRRIRDWFVEMRTRLGIEIALATGGTEVMRRLESFVGDGGAVALLCDRDLRGRGVPVRFFGETTTLPAGPATVALRAGVPIVPVAVYFEPGGGHRTVVRTPFEVVQAGDRTETIRRTTQRIAEELEVLVRGAPEQWHLLQPNWPSDREPAT